MYAHIQVMVGVRFSSSLKIHYDKTFFLLKITNAKVQSKTQSQMYVYCKQELFELDTEVISTCSNLGGLREGNLGASKEFLKYDITVNPIWIQIQDPNVQSNMKRFDHAVGVITQELANQLCLQKRYGCKINKSAGG